MLTQNEAVKQILQYMDKQCNFCTGGFGAPGIAATRICYVPKITSHYLQGYFCDQHSFNNYEVKELQDIKYSWKKRFGAIYPPQEFEFEFEDLPCAEAIRLLYKSAEITIKHNMLEFNEKTKY